MITEELKRCAFVVNAKRVRRLMHEDYLVIAVRRCVTTSTGARDRRELAERLLELPPVES